MAHQRIAGLALLAAVFLLSGCGSEKPESEPAQTDEPVRVALETSEGEIVLEVSPAQAPVTVRNCLRYVDEGFWGATVFHRVVNQGIHVIQGGGFTKTMDRKPPMFPPIKNEADNGLSNVAGTIAMARTNDPGSATSQFFINTVDNTMLDAQGDNPGYAVFGKVIEGMDVAKKIADTETHSIGHGARQMMDVPVDPPMIIKARRRN